ncbi:death-associated inhibitor of apoptosis 2-like [Argopecten irradians]|uniref:death-associated inhibitor of apoptosis 2-like n=1 Tax=Argopecten irradians TaxID=31199 RepID=UPI003720D7B7
MAEACSDIQVDVTSLVTLCRESFVYWPGDLSLDVDNMAEAGWRYHGNGRIETICCTVGWCSELTGDPWIQHAIHSPMCPFLKTERTTVTLEMDDESELAQTSALSPQDDPVLVQADVQNESILAPASAQSPQNESVMDPSSAQSPQNESLMDPSSAQSPQNESVMDPSSAQSPQNESVMDPSSAQSPQIESVMDPSSAQISETDHTDDPNPRDDKVLEQPDAINLNDEQFLGLPGIMPSSEELEKKMISKENMQLRRQINCFVCEEEPRKKTYLPCRHLACCEICDQAQLKCPICKQLIEVRIKTYW